MSTFDNEAITLGLVLRYDTDAAQVVLPELTPDKFIFNADGTFGSDHEYIWQAIADCYLVDSLRPTYVNVAAHLDDTYHDYLRLLIDQLEKYYHIYTLDAKELAQYATDVDKAGIIYNVAQQSKRVSIITNTNEDFERMVNSVHDVSEWVNDVLNTYHTSLSFGTEGYQHISVAASRVREEWEMQYNKEQTIILPCGLPTLVGNRLFPLRKLAVIHGLSGSGKSAFVHQVNLGTAIGLVAEGIKGCVAINSLEMEQEDLVERMASVLAGIDVSTFQTGTISKEDYERLLGWLEFAEKLPIYVDDTNFITTSAMEYRSRGLHVTHGPIIQLSSDYGELFKDEGDSEEMRVNKVFREHFSLSRKIGASVIAISQSTASKQDTNRTYLAGPDGTRYSRGVLHGADILAELWNPVQMKASGRQFIVPEGLNDVHPWLIVQKYRKGKMGALPMGWNAEYTQFFDLAMTHSPGHEKPFEHLPKALDKFGMSHLLHPKKKKRGIW